MRLIGWPLGAAIAGGDPNWTLAAIGGGLVVVAIPFSVAYTKNAKRAVELYNSGLANQDISCIDFQFGITGNGLGLKITF